MIFGAGGTAIIFLLLAILFAGRKISLNYSILYVIFYIVLQFFSFFYNDGVWEDSTWLFRDIVLIVATYLYISSVSFYKFRIIFTNIVYVLCLLGIPIFLLNEVGLLPVYRVQVGNESFRCFGIYTLGWTENFHRFSGIFHEPGSWQILLNLTLWLNADIIIGSNKLDKNQLFKYVVIIIGLLITFSTGGYIAFALYLIAFVVCKKFYGSFKYVLYIVLFLTIIFSLIILYNSDVVQNKLFGYHISTETRTNNFNACLRIASEHPFFGCGNNTRIFKAKSEAYGNLTSSAGVITYTAMLGFCWLFVFLFVVWKTAKRLYHRLVLQILFIGAFLAMNMNEAITYTPLISLFLIPFKAENNQSKLIK
jgi:O-antigen ligase